MDAEQFRVRLRANKPVLYRNDPVTLTVDPTLSSIFVAEYIIPLHTFDICKSFFGPELTLSTSTRRLYLRPISTPDTRWRQLVDLLFRLRDSPNGYLIQSRIGHGASGTVYHAHILRTGASVALKQVRKTVLAKQTWALNAARREQHILDSLPKHPNIVSATHVFETPAALYTAMELIRGRELLYHLSQQPQLSTEHIITITKQLLSAVAHVHAHNVLHRDIKLENVMISTTQHHVDVLHYNQDEYKHMMPHVHLVDFGLAHPIRNATDRQRLSRVGTTYCQAPELVLSPSSHRGVAEYGAPADVWAVGIILFCLIHRRIPWTDSKESQREPDMKRMVELARDGSPGSYMNVLQSEKEQAGVREDLQSLLCALLQPDAKKRLTARAALEHRVFASVQNGIGRGMIGNVGERLSLKMAARRVLAVMRSVECLNEMVGNGNTSTRNVDKTAVAVS